MGFSLSLHFQYSTPTQLWASSLNVEAQGPFSENGSRAQRRHSLRTGLEILELDYFFKRLSINHTVFLFPSLGTSRDRLWYKLLSLPEFLQYTLCSSVDFHSSSLGFSLVWLGQTVALTIHPSCCIFPVMSLSLLSVMSLWVYSFKIPHYPLFV